MDEKDLEALWDGLLSREMERVRAAFQNLEAEERRAVLAHLKRMAEEDGWHAEQRASARAALDILSED